MQLSAITSSPVYSPSGPLDGRNPTDKTDPEQHPEQKTPTDSQQLSEADHRQIAQLQKIDREVRAHEAAHIAASGGLARGGASFSYVQGPDGKRYAVAGEVSIDTSPVRGDPQATLLKAQRIQAAALAPAQPSSADRAIAASAASMASTARAELLAERVNPEETETRETAQQESKTDEQLPVLGNDDDSNTESVGRQMRRSQVNRTNAELGELIKQATSVESRLGNLLDTAV